MDTEKFYNTLELYPELQVLKDNIDIIKLEINEFIKNEHDWIK